MNVNPPPSWLMMVVLTVVLLAAPADAQRGRGRGRAAATAPAPRFGPHLGYAFDYDEVLLGAQLSWAITPRVELYPSFDYYFVDPAALWALNADLKLRPPSRSGALYVGGGLNYTRSSARGSGDTGLNLLTGLEGRRSRTVPYVEAKFVLGDNTTFQLVGGFSVR